MPHTLEQPEECRGAPATEVEQRRFRTLTENCPVCIYYADTRGRCLYVNERWCELAGIPRSEALGEQWLEAVHPEDREAVAAAWHAGMQSGHPFALEFRFSRPDESAVWVSSNAAPECDEDDHTVGWVGTLADVSDRKHAELELQKLNAELEKRVEARTAQLRLANEALQEETRKRARSAQAARHNHELFAAFMANLPGVAFIKDANGKYVYVNAQFSHLCPQDPNHGLGKTDYELMPKQYAEACAASDRRVLRENKALQVIESVPLADGMHHWLVHKFPLEPVRGQATLVAGAVLDITERRRAEEALARIAAEARDLYNNAPCGYHSIDADGIYVEVNDTELAWLGYTREEMVGKLKFADLLTAQSRPLFYESFESFKASGGPITVDYEMVRKDGTLMPVILNATAIKDSAGHFLRSRTTIVDISERKQG